MGSFFNPAFHLGRRDVVISDIAAVINITATTVTVCSAGIFTSFVASPTVIRSHLRMAIRITAATIVNPPQSATAVAASQRNHPTAATISRCAIVISRTAILILVCSFATADKPPRSGTINTLAVLISAAAIRFIAAVLTRDNP